MFTAFRKERNRCGGSAVAANGRIMREGETTRIIRPFAHHSRILRDAGLQRAIGLRILPASLSPPHDPLRKACGLSGSCPEIRSARYAKITLPPRPDEYATAVPGASRTVKRFRDAHQSFSICMDQTGALTSSSMILIDPRFTPAGLRSGDAPAGCTRVEPCSSDPNGLRPSGRFSR